MAYSLNKEFGLEVGTMTDHAFTSSQMILMGQEHKLRLNWTASNTIPHSTGIAKAIGLVIPELDGHLQGMPNGLLSSMAPCANWSLC